MLQIDPDGYMKVKEIVAGRSQEDILEELDTDVANKESMHGTET